MSNFWNRRVLEKEKEDRQVWEKEKKQEHFLSVQSGILTGIFCLLCAGMILCQMFYVQPVNIYVGANSSVQENPSPAAQSGIINLNTASLEELTALPSIGKVRAQAIIDYRNTHGPFQTTEEVTAVKGIGEKTYEAIRKRITVEEEK